MAGPQGIARRCGAAQVRGRVGGGRTESVDRSLFVARVQSFTHKVLVNPFVFRYIDDVGREVRPNEARSVCRAGFCFGEVFAALP